MKKVIVLSGFLLLTLILSAQSPQSFRYQAVARDNSGNVLANQNVSFRISILNESASGTIIYREIHTGKTTNAFGLVELEIGKGTPVNGTFSTINWGSNTYFVQVEMDPAAGSSYQVLSTSQLLSVPYALHAKTVETGDNWGSQTVVSDATLTGNGTTGSNLKLAQQSATSGQVLKWNGTNWIPKDDLTGGVPSGTAGGDLTGTYPDPIIGIGKVTESKIASGAVNETKLSSMGASAGQVLAYSGSNWAPQTIVSSPWQTNINNLYYNAGFVGIGTSAVSHPLTIENANNTCYIRLKDNQGASGMRIGAYTGELAFINDNAQKNIRFTTYTGSVYKQILTLNANTLKVGINTDTPPYDLSVMGSGSPSEISIHTSGTGTSGTDGLRIGMSNTLNSWIWNNEFGDLYFGTNNLERMRINRDGKVGIGDNTPEATLDVQGTVVIGSGGKIFSEIREISGSTSASGGSITFSFPTGYSMWNIRVLSLEINYKGNSWIGLGGNQQNTSINERIFYYLGSFITIYYPPVADFQNKAFRMMVMKVE